MTKKRSFYGVDYKRQIVEEYLSGRTTASELARREGVTRGQIYKWRTQLEQHARVSRTETIAQEEGVTPDQARRIQDLEEELLATQRKLAQTLLENDLLKKLQPNSRYVSGSSGYSDMKRQLGR